jgi:hypothetical protein
MDRMKSLKLISREDARTAKRVKILTRKDFAGVTAQATSRIEIAAPT